MTYIEYDHSSVFFYITVQATRFKNMDPIQLIRAVFPSILTTNIMKSL